MTAPEYFIFDGGTDAEGAHPPRRPSVDDLGGDETVDDLEFPPDPREHPTAAGHNQTVKVVAAIGRTAASAKIEVRFNTGTPFVNRCTGLGSAIATSTFSPADNSTGDTTITWPAGTFPDFEISPNGLTLYSSSTQVVAGHVEEVTNGIRVRTFVNGAAADVAWSICLN